MQVLSLQNTAIQCTELTPLAKNLGSCTLLGLEGVCLKVSSDCIPHLCPLCPVRVRAHRHSYPLGPASLRRSHQRIWLR